MLRHKVLGILALFLLIGSVSALTIEDSQKEILNFSDNAVCTSPVSCYIEGTIILPYSTQINTEEIQIVGNSDITAINPKRIIYESKQIPKYTLIEKTPKIEYNKNESQKSTPKEPILEPKISGYSSITIQSETENSLLGLENQKIPYKIYFDVPFNSAGKFDIMVTLGENTYILDPWYNSSFQQRIPLHNVSNLAINSYFPTEKIPMVLYTWNSSSLGGNLSAYLQLNETTGDLINLAVLLNDTKEQYYALTILGYGIHFSNLNNSPDNLTFFSSYDWNTSCLDLSGNGVECTLINLELDDTHTTVGVESNEVGDFGLIEHLDYPTEFSFSYWSKTTNDGETLPLADQFDDISNYFQIKSRAENREPALVVKYGGTTYLYAYSESSIWNNGEWHHYAITVNLTNATVRFWEDGNLLDSFYEYRVPKADGLHFTNNLSMPSGLRGGTQYLGSFDDLRIYDKILTEEDVEDLYYSFSSMYGGDYEYSEDYQTDLDYSCPDFVSVNNLFTLWADYTTKNGSDILDAWVNLTLNDVEYNLSYNEVTGRYEQEFMALSSENISVVTYANKTIYESQNYNCTIQVGEGFNIFVNIWEEIEKKVFARTNNSIITVNNYDVELIDPYINDMAYIFFINLDKNATGEYQDCNLPFGSAEGTIDLLNIGSWMGDNLTNTVTDLYGGIVYCDKYWFRAPYRSGTANISLLWSGNYSIWLISGNMAFENTYSPPKISHSGISIPFGTINFKNTSNYEIDLFVSHSELDFWGSLSDTFFIFFATILPLMALIVLLLIGVDFKTAIGIALSIPLIFTILNMAGL
jgi:hypothetical protein